MRADCRIRVWAGWIQLFELVESSGEGTPRGVVGPWEIGYRDDAQIVESVSRRVWWRDERQ